MIDRKIMAEIIENIQYFPAVGIIGPRQVGKTTLAKEVQNVLPTRGISKTHLPQPPCTGIFQKLSKKWLLNFANTFMERDLKAMGYEISLQTMSRLYRMVAHVHGQLQNASSLAQALGVSVPTVIKYLDLLEGGFLLRRLEPYFVNVGKRLIKSPKIYFRDTGLLHQLATVPSFEALQGNQLIGASWEGYVIEQIRRAVDGSWQFFYYRTVAGAETDVELVLVDAR